MSDFRTTAVIKSKDSGGFTAVASSGSIDRDGEIVAPYAFDPLPASVPVHLDHSFSAANVVARAVPRYDAAGRLLLDAKYGSDPESQLVRTKVLDGLIDSMSVFFIHAEYDRTASVPTIVKGELMSVDLVSIPSNRDALILSAKSLGRDPAAVLAMAKSVLADAQRTLDTPVSNAQALARAKSVLADAESVLGHGPARRLADALIADALSDSREETPRAYRPFGL